MTQFIQNAVRYSIIFSLYAGLSFCAVAQADNITTENNLSRAQQAILQATAPQTQWDGPTSGPNIVADKQIIFIASDMKNGGVLGVYDGMQEATKITHWQLDALDGAGSVSNQLAALNQAIARKPDAIVIAGWNPNFAKAALRKAAQQGIKLVSWHASPNVGAMDKYNIFTNITSNSDDTARLAAQYAVAQSNGTAKVIILTDSLYAIALHKANVMKSVIEACEQCQLLEFIDTPLADTANRMPGLTFSLLQKYGDNLQYTLAINDLYYDFMAPTLRSAKYQGDNKPYNISAGDGSVTAFQRIRKAQYQTATIPEPLNLHGWQLVDELNRAFAGENPSGYVTPVHLVTKQNIPLDNRYDPSNGYRKAYQAIWF